MIYQSPRDIVINIQELGSLPQSLAAVMKAINNSDTGAKEIAEIISRDVSLTTRLLKMVNSSNYARKGKVSKVSEAVIVMGVNNIKTMILGSSVFGMTPDRELMKIVNIRKIWRHLLEVAINARSIAEQAEYSESEEAFIAGILHDIGIIILLMHYKKDYAEIMTTAREKNLELTAVEEETFGYNHAQVGAELIDSWHLPKKLSYAVRNHHNTEDTSTHPDESRLCDIVSLADRLAVGSIEIFHSDIIEMVHETRTLTDNLKLDYEFTGKIRKESLPRSLEMAAYLELDVGDVIETITDANSRMAELYFRLERIYLEQQGYYEDTARVKKQNKTVNV